MIYVDNTLMRYIPLRSFIKLETGEIRSTWFGLWKKPVYALYEVVNKGNDHSATMDVYLIKKETGEEKKLSVSPNRRFNYYVEEIF